MRSKRIKILLSVIFCVLLSSSALGQAYRFRTTDAIYQIKENDSDWSTPTDWIETSILVIYEIKKERITFYSDEIQTYDIIKIVDVTPKDSPENHALSIDCVNQDGILGNIKIGRSEKMGDNVMLQVTLPNVCVTYRGYKLYPPEKAP